MQVNVINGSDGLNHCRRYRDVDGYDCLFASLNPLVPSLWHDFAMH